MSAAEGCPGNGSGSESRNGSTSRPRSSCLEVLQLQLQLTQALAEIENIKAIATVSEDTKQEAIDQVRYQCQQEVTSLHAIITESLGNYEEQLKSVEKEREQWRQYQETMERELSQLRQQLSGNLPHGSLENHTSKAQEDAERLRWVVMPMEEEIASLKQKLARAQEQLSVDPLTAALGSRWEVENAWTEDSVPLHGQSPREWVSEEKEGHSERLAEADTFAGNCAAYSVGSRPAACPEKVDTASLHSTATLVPESIYLPPAGHQLLPDEEWNRLQQEMKKYQVTLHQTQERLERESTIRKNLEQALRQSTEECSQELSILREKIDVSTLEVQRIKELFTETQHHTHKQMAELMETQKEVCQKNRLLHRENKAVRALCVRLQGKAEDSQGGLVWPTLSEDSSEAVANQPSQGKDHFLDEAYNEVLNRLEEKIAEVEILQRQRQEMEAERAVLNLKIQEEKAKGQRLQVELDTSEQVQRDFVKLSQALQVRLEQIRQSDSLETIRQIVDSVSSLKDASQLQGAWEPAS